jgi:tetratricopeptide (TPR) repeat protein
MATPYHKRWGLAIGIDYKPEDRRALNAVGEIPSLSNAQNDARQLADVLEKKYKFRGDDGKVVVLTGQEATYTKIRQMLENKLINSKDVTEDDCVLVYFSGHGDQSNKEDGKGFMLPIDVGWEGGSLVETSAIPLEEVVDFLKKSRARHKLLILDSCYSGQVFHALKVVGHSGGEFEELDTKLDVFSARAIQAITSSRDAALDSNPGGKKNSDHSPFTTALLRSLKSIPLSLPLNHYRFTASELFKPMKELTRDLPQSAQCRWLDEQLQGQFHFFPDPDVRYDEDEIPAEFRRLLVAMVPSTFGNWWADEMPWFMPGLRRAILEDSAKFRSTERILTRQEIRDAARQMIYRTAEGEGKQETGLSQRRMRHLRLMFELEQGQDRIKVMKTVIDGIPGQFQGLRAMTETGTPEGVDLHYLAVLYQKLGQPELAHRTYDDALRRYEKEGATSLESRVLRVLCLLDIGLLELEVMNYPEAASLRFREAAERFGLETPPPFHALCLIKESDALRRTGVIGKADVLMKRAHGVLENFDRYRANLLSAAAYKQEAWGCMETWRFQKARSHFEISMNMINKYEHKYSKGSFGEEVIDQLHIMHGLAMIERFQGRDESARDQYRKLTSEIDQEILKLERSADPPANYAEIRNLLYSRLVNSLERQADCSLFGRTPDYSEAADDYRRALEALELLPKATQDPWRRDLAYRRVMSLALSASVSKPTAPTVLDTSESQALLSPLDLGLLLMRQLEEAERGEQRGRADVAKQRAGAAQAMNLATLLSGAALNPAPIIGAVDLAHLQAAPLRASEEQEAANLVKVASSEELARLLAYACLDFAASSVSRSRPGTKPAMTCMSPGSPTSALCKLAAELTRSPHSFDRDELERLMFTYRLLMHMGRDRFGATDRIRFADSLLKLCRAALHAAAREERTKSIGLLRYLRPYFEAAFVAKAEAEPGQVKELIEIAYEATTGDSYFKNFPVSLSGPIDRSTQQPAVLASVPVLALFIAEGRCYLLLDAPRGNSTVIVADRPVDDLKMIAASSISFSCPAELQQALDRVELGPEGFLAVLWRDPVYRLTEIIPTVRETGSPRELGPYFPFKLSPNIPKSKLRDLITPGSYRLLWAEDGDPEGSKKREEEHAPPLAAKTGKRS